MSLERVGYVRHSTDCTCCDFGHLRFLFIYLYLGRTVDTAIEKSIEGVDQTKKAALDKLEPYKSGWTLQFWACLQRAIRSILKEPILIKIRVIQNVVSITSCTYTHDYYSIWQSFSDPAISSDSHHGEGLVNPKVLALLKDY
jgi:hypothetical protein